jgi:hypothetical protein
VNREAAPRGDLQAIVMHYVGDAGKRHVLLQSDRVCHPLADDAVTVHRHSDFVHSLLLS